MAIAEIPSLAEVVVTRTRPQANVRVWPAWGIVLLQAIAFGLSVTPAISNPDRFGYMMLGPLGCLFLFAAWMLFLSKLRWSERLLTLTAFAVPAVLAGLLIDGSVGIAMFLYGAPLGITMVATVMTLGRDWEPRHRF